MNINASILCAALAILFHSQASCSEQLNPKEFIKQRGWQPYESKHIPQPPNAEIAPVLYYNTDSPAPSCGLISTIPGKNAPRFTELTTASQDESFPQCPALVSMLPFRLDSKEYVSVEYLVKETREDMYRNFTYLYRDAKEGYLVDKALSDDVEGKAVGISAMIPSQARALEGIRAARIAFLKRKYKQWQLQERDFISDKASSFAIFADTKAKECHIVTEAGGNPVAAVSGTAANGGGCTKILASSKLEKSGAVYYIGLFKSATGKQYAAITSVTPDGIIKIAEEEAEIINRAGATKDIKTVKAAISNSLHR